MRLSRGGGVRSRLSFAALARCELGFFFVFMTTCGGSDTYGGRIRIARPARSCQPSELIPRLRAEGERVPGLREGSGWKKAGRWPRSGASGNRCGESGALGLAVGVRDNIRHVAGPFDLIGTRVGGDGIGALVRNSSHQEMWVGLPERQRSTLNLDDCEPKRRCAVRNLRDSGPTVSSASEECFPNPGQKGHRSHYDACDERWTNPSFIPHREARSDAQGLRLVSCCFGQLRDFGGRAKKKVAPLSRAASTQIRPP